MEKDVRLKALLCYVWIIGIILFFVERDNAFVRFNAAQAILLFALLLIGALLGWIPFIGWIFCFVLSLVAILASVVCAINCWNGRSFRLPIAAEYADKMARTF